MIEKNYLIYDKGCPFCVNIAFFLKHFVQINNLILIPNSHMYKIKKLSKKLTSAKICKDVHLIEKYNNKICIFSGADAAAKVFSMKKELGFIWKLHLKLPIIFKIIYFISKKIRVFILEYYK